MDDDLTQLEAELKRLRPAPLAPELTARIAAVLGTVARPRRERTFALLELDRAARGRGGIRPPGAPG